MLRHSSLFFIAVAIGGVGCGDDVTEPPPKLATCPAVSAICDALCRPGETPLAPEDIPDGCAQPVCTCDVPCQSDKDCGDGLACNTRVCNPPPDCEEGRPCRDVCYGECIPDIGDECPPLDDFCTLACNGLPTPDIPNGCPIPGCLCPPPPDTCKDGTQCPAGTHCEENCCGFCDPKGGCENECYSTCEPDDDRKCIPPDDICRLECAGIPVPPMGPECPVASCDCGPDRGCESDRDCGPGAECQIACTAGLCSPEGCEGGCFGTCVPRVPHCGLLLCPEGTHCEGFCPPCDGDICPLAPCFLECVPDDRPPVCPDPAWYCQSDAVGGPVPLFPPECPVPVCPPYPGPPPTYPPAPPPSPGPLVPPQI